MQSGHAFRQRFQIKDDDCRRSGNPTANGAFAQQPIERIACGFEQNQRIGYIRIKTQCRRQNSKSTVRSAVCDCRSREPPRS